MVKILNCYLYAKKSYGTLSKGAIFLAIPVILLLIECWKSCIAVDISFYIAVF